MSKERSNDSAVDIVGRVITAQYESNGRTKKGLPYNNSYSAFFEVINGRIVRWREYFNPDVLIAAGLR